MSENYNRSAIRRHALRVSEVTRAGKFTRVSEEFIDGVVAEIDNERRRLRSDQVTIGMHAPLPPSTDDYFITGAGRDGLCADFDLFVGKIIQKKVHLTRVGKTL